jgi:betaine reductase
VIAKEIERSGIPVAFITAMTKMATQVGANRIVTGIKIPHPCGNPTLPEEADYKSRLEIVKTALRALQTDVTGPTVFEPDITRVSG